VCKYRWGFVTVKFEQNKAPAVQNIAHHVYQQQLSAAAENQAAVSCGEQLGQNAVQQIELATSPHQILRDGWLNNKPMSYTTGSETTCTLNCLNTRTRSVLQGALGFIVIQSITDRVQTGHEVVVDAGLHVAEDVRVVADLA
jgi:hypothetical protein